MSVYPIFNLKCQIRVIIEELVTKLQFVLFKSGLICKSSVNASLLTDDGELAASLLTNVSMYEWTRKEKKPLFMGVLFLLGYANGF